jgi:hypothetical protein
MDSFEERLAKADRYVWWTPTFIDYIKRGKPRVPIVEYSHAEPATKWTIGWELWRKVDGEWIYVNDRLHRFLDE